MGETERFTEYRKKRLSFGDENNALITLVGINGVIFIALTFIKLLFYFLQSTPESFQQNIIEWFVFPAEGGVLAYRPWTILSYMFTHQGLIALFTNMIWLWVFGSVFQTVSDSRKLIPIYLYGGVTGAVVFITCMHVFPYLHGVIPGSTLEGASAATMAVAVATTTLVPQYRFFRMINGGIPLWIITGIYIFIDFTRLGGTNGAYHAADIGGALVGYLFIYSWKKGRDWSAWMINGYNSFMNLFTPKKVQPRRSKLRDKVFYNTSKSKPFVKIPNITQERIDEILDKINQKGYDSLTEDEKLVLKKAGETDL
jgi:membrane associated rhomboid family serine protease